MFLGYFCWGEPENKEYTKYVKWGKKRRSKGGVESPRQDGGPSYPIRGSGKTDTLRLEWKTPLSGEWVGHTALWGEGSRQRGRKDKGQEG